MRNVAARQLQLHYANAIRIRFVFYLEKRTSSGNYTGLNENTMHCPLVPLRRANRVRFSSSALPDFKDAIISAYFTLLDGYILFLGRRPCALCLH